MQSYMNKVVYICTGGCGAIITQEQYDEGLTKCGAKGCLHHGHPFEKRLKCADCGKIFLENQTHKH